MLTKTHKTRLQKICKVLFPKFRYIHINTYANKVTFGKSKCWLIRLFTAKMTYSMDELIQYRIPNQLSDFLYGNTTFINVIQEELVRCRITNQSVIDYFYEEIARIKYADIYKQIKINPDTIILTPAPDNEDEMWDEMIQYQSDKMKSEHKGSIRLFIDLFNTNEARFYTALFFLVLLSFIMKT